MAQLSRETKIRNQREKNVKAKKAADTKTKAMLSVVSTDKAMTGDAPIDVKGTAVATMDDNLPVIALSASLNTAEKDPKKQKYVVTDDQKAFVTKLIDNDMTATLGNLRKSSAELTWNVACIAVALCCRLMRDRETALPLVDKFFDALASVDGQGVVRTNAIKAWFEAYAPVTWGKDNLKKNRFLIDTKKHKDNAAFFGRKQPEYINQRLADPFFKFKPEAGFQSFDFDAQLKALIKRAKDYKALDENAKKAKFGDDYAKTLKLGAFEIIAKAADKIPEPAAADAPNLEVQAA